MTLFVDTSAIVALVDRDDPWNAQIQEAFALGRSEPLATHAYVVIETLAVARRRLGPRMTGQIVDHVLPAMDVVAVDSDLHAAAVVAFRASIESSVSLVDRTSFAFMRREGMTRAIALDPDFIAAGFVTLPSAASSDRRS